VVYVASGGSPSLWVPGTGVVREVTVGEPGGGPGRGSEGYGCSGTDMEGTGPGPGGTVTLTVAGGGSKVGRIVGIGIVGRGEIGTGIEIGRLGRGSDGSGNEGRSGGIVKSIVVGSGSEVGSRLVSGSEGIIGSDRDGRDKSDIDTEGMASGITKLTVMGSVGSRSDSGIDGIIERGSDAERESDGRGRAGRGKSGIDIEGIMTRIVELIVKLRRIKRTRSRYVRQQYTGQYRGNGSRCRDIPDTRLRCRRRKKRNRRWLSHHVRHHIHGRRMLSVKMCVRKIGGRPSQNFW